MKAKESVDQTAGQGKAKVNPHEALYFEDIFKIMAGRSIDDVSLDGVSFDEWDTDRRRREHEIIKAEMGVAK
ncbi:MAG: hypothetical protein LBP55_03555 [Candidatus Adiutrix sp.]|nr:hypothetical protein [Candidatus Adiutrix sp.]